MKKLNNIQEILDSKGVKITWLAEQMGVSYPTAHNWVHNKKQPDLSQLIRMSDILNTTLKSLININ